MLSLDGWINGLSSLIILLSGLLFGFFLIYKAIRTHAKLLGVMGIAMILLGLVFLGLTTEFFVVLLSGMNLDNSGGIIGILGYFWVAFAVIPAVYIGSELIFPKVKWYLVVVFSVLGIFYELILFLDTASSFNFTYPNIPGEDLIDDPLVIGSPFFLFFLSYVGISIIFDGLGCLIKGLKSEGIIRKKLFFLSLGFLIFLSVGTLDQLHLPGIVLLFVRIPMIVSFWLWYVGLREVSIEKKPKPKKEVKVEEGLFRLIRRPDNITEEEISISKEKKICLVCKGKATGITFICTECEAIYCVNCSQAISNLENRCWVCNAPIDPTKPVKEIVNQVKPELEIDVKKKE
ncbi:MAG: hypothetical protein EAX91_16810 [Candidatus Lokiarchaeota archaeon]|nr:hypothetical protein [Candidatus Lokiarchaeota archaeon]